MKSPYADCYGVLKFQKVETEYRGDKYDHLRFYFECPITGRLFTTADIDQASNEQVRTQYRERHNIPAADKLIRYRIGHCLSQKDMAVRSGFSEEQYKRFENGFDVPTPEEGSKLRAAIEE